MRINKIYYLRLTIIKLKIFFFKKHFLHFNFFEVLRRMSYYSIVLYCLCSVWRLNWIVQQPLWCQYIRSVVRSATSALSTLRIPVSSSYLDLECRNVVTGFALHAGNNISLDWTDQDHKFFYVPYVFLLPYLFILF